MNSIDVLDSCGFKLDKQHLEVAPPHLTDKMIVDLVNGIEVIDDQIKVSKTRTSRWDRFKDSFSGRANQRESIINDNLAKCLQSTATWLQNHDYELASVNLAITKVTDKLLETRTGVMKLNDKHNELKESVIQLANTVEEKNSKLYDYIRDIDLRTRADRQLDRAIAKWQAGGYTSDVYTNVFMILDTLKNNEFGLYIDNGNSNLTIKNEMLEHLKHEIQNQLCNELSISSTVFNSSSARFRLENVAKNINEIGKSHLLCINYLSDWSTQNKEPNTWLLNQLSEATIERKEAQVLTLFPKNIRVNRWSERLTNENIYLRNA
ncbi:hypothetical protein NCCP2140_31460 [Pseudoalteromonas sp. NCCP-2140]|uniref:diguanylate cyclase regulator RdcB family protein n=1 Tax=Alteromonadales TaxID=135622 RepID=UPI0015BA3CE1|nr:diguanylate cyclase regulator RdcB family protein [Pseudoalteromonas sp. NCCP-2140]QLE07550.1 hypothetical protein HYD28_00405 [Pseudoalteromonas shioyasakiensis]GKW54093.1 hypothetical protein NCCP2140_31460 [Pseudoalteromonas sp. NCCP-2140]